MTDVLLYKTQENTTNASVRGVQRVNSDRGLFINVTDPFLIYQFTRFYAEKDSWICTNNEIWWRCEKNPNTFEQMTVCKSRLKSIFIIRKLKIILMFLGFSSSCWTTWRQWTYFSFKSLTFYIHSSEREANDHHQVKHSPHILRLKSWEKQNKFN